MGYNQPYYNNAYNSNPYIGGGYYQPNQMNNTYQQISQYPQFSQTQVPFVNGKYVDGIDVVRASEVPMGGIGFFIKADMSELYTKSWNSDGTTKITTYKPVVEASAKDNENQISTDSIMEQISLLNEKVDKLVVGLGA